MNPSMFSGEMMAEGSRSANRASSGVTFSCCEEWDRSSSQGSALTGSFDDEFFSIDLLIYLLVSAAADISRPLQQTSGAAGADISPGSRCPLGLTSPDSRCPLE